jgi:hypothetical protein
MTTSTTTNINLIDFIYGNYITNGIIDHDYNTHSLLATSTSETRATTSSPAYALVIPTI